MIGDTGRKRDAGPTLKLVEPGTNGIDLAIMSDRRYAEVSNRGRPAIGAQNSGGGIQQCQ